MLRGKPLLKPYVNLHRYKMDNLKDINALKGVLRWKNMNPNYYVY